MTGQSLSVFLMVSILASMASCSKNQESKPVDNQKIKLIQKHTWILDSTNTITNSYNITQPEVPSSSYVFLSDTMIVNYHGTQLIKYNLEYENPEKIYFWFLTETKNIDEYIIIDAVDDTKLKAREIDVATKRTRIKFYHAQ